MNDKQMIDAIRKLPARYVKPGIDVTRYGASILACHPDFPGMKFVGGKWKKIDVTTAVRR